MDNIFIERLWRSLKYEDVHLKGYACGREARTGIAAWIRFYNGGRPHQALGNRTPMPVWREGTRDALVGNAVDMPLRLDDAAASPHAHSDNHRNSRPVRRDREGRSRPAFQ